MNKTRCPIRAAVTLVLLGPAAALAADKNAGKSSDDVIETVNVFATMSDQLSVGSKAGQSLREIPKSVTLVTNERIEAQNLTTLVDALNQSTGVTLASYSSVDPFYFSRGFRMHTVQIDGGAPAYTGSFGSFWTPDMAMYERVEVLRGVDGMYTGAGEPGGIVNLVRKRARETTQIQFNTTAGRWDNYRGEIDVTGSLGMDDRLRGRAVAVYEDRGYYVDRTSTEKSLFYGTVEFDLTPSTLLVAGGSYEKRDEGAYSGGRGLPRYSDGGDLRLPRETNLAPDWNHWNFDTEQYFLRAEQQYGVDGVVKLNYTRIDQTSELRYMYPLFPVDRATGAGTIGLGYAGDYQSEQNLIDLSASGSFRLFGREHSYTVGGDYAKIDGGGQREYDLEGYVWPDGPPIDVFNFNPALYPKPRDILTGVYPKNGQKQQGIFAIVGLQLTDPLRLTLGARYSEFEYEQTYQPVAGTATVSKYDDSTVVPSVALNYRINDEWSAYASYGETFRAQSNLLKAPLPGSPLDPITGDGYEVGIKGEILGFLNASAAVYHIARVGEGVRDPAYPFTPGQNGSSCCYLDTADVTSEGFDAEVSGIVLPGWQLFGGYTYNRTEDRGGSSGPVWFLGMTPKHMVKLWTTWQLPGALSRFTLNGGVNAQSETYIESFTFPGTRFTQSGYALWNAAIQYQLTRNLTVALYGENLFDKRYYQVLGDIYNENVYGMPRSWMLNIRGRW